MVSLHFLLECAWIGCPVSRMSISHQCLGLCQSISQISLWKRAIQLHGPSIGWVVKKRTEGMLIYQVLLLLGIAMQSSHLVDLDQCICYVLLLHIVWPYTIRNL